MVSSYPLSWPVGKPRTEPHKRSRARFGTKGSNGWMRETTFQEAASMLYRELELLKAKNAVLSSNLQLRNDGIPYANQRRPEDVGIAVYFSYEGNDTVMSCDMWDRPEDNIKAIAKTIENLRGIERWGSKDMMKASFRGFMQLPSPDMIVPARRWFSDCNNLEELEHEYRLVAKELHPDVGGDVDEFTEMKRQYEMERKRLLV